MVDQLRRAVIALPTSSFSGRRRHRGDRGAQCDGQLHRGQADAAAGAEHDQLVAGLNPRHRTQRVVRGAVGDAERGRGAVVDAVGDRASAGADTTTCSANAPNIPVPVTRSPTAKPVCLDPTLVDDAGELAARARTAAARLTW